MEEKTIKMPKIGESVLEASIIQWLKKEGEMIHEGESIVEVATDKVDSEIPTPYAGTIIRTLVQPGQVITIGQPIAIIQTERSLDVATSLTYVNIDAKSSTKMPIKEQHQNNDFKDEGYFPRYDRKGRYHSPLIRYIAQKEGISLEEIETIPATGQDHRLTKADLFTYLDYRTTRAIHLPTTKAIAEVEVRPGDVVVPMDRVRKIIADKMVQAIQTVPHVTSFIEGDVTNLVSWRQQHKDSFKQKTGVNLTYTAIFTQIVAQALKEFPMLNSSITGDQIIQRNAINIGIAVALANNNLIVPVIKKADQLTLFEVAIQLHRLVSKAQQGTLSPDDVTEGTYTISNIGSFQNLMGTPLIMVPQVAILALGNIVKKPAVIETSAGDQIAIRHTLFLSHTYDHRIIDGALGGKFIKYLTDRFENLDTVEKLT